jgi:predicted lipid-binding transport protein (Tim44 family)
MYGKWFMWTAGVIFVVLLAIGLIAVPWVAIFAVVIAFLIALAFLFSRASQRRQQLGSEHAAAAEDRRQAGQPARPSASAAPRSGEGT